MFCHECRFFHSEPRENRSPLFECRRRAPTGTVYQGELYGVFPTMDPMAWCGEFELSSHVSDANHEQAESGGGE